MLTNPQFRVTTFGILCSILLSACSQPDEPKEVISIWNNSLYEGQVKLARKYTSYTASEYLAALGGLEVLAERYQSNAVNRPSIIFEEQKIDGNTARVGYTGYYKDGSIKHWEDTLFREDGVWKVAPQYVRVIRK